ncbi:site-specific DNA-methyltransferase [Dietzia cinnamea]|uniref:site-specific DNA-methyltransferase n=1 Tax=Dietzia cinnamea TaxID=321318 RepID=UPI0021A425A7|nr:DNA methyltransferase [Dietzia cinnamea]MCT1886314.1 site-specific DNA-methyltransferase [Dietzia cinnamea]MCT2098631.1 site-specific DNA-methyltransferase [Dietzia cinnamea]
MSRLTELLRQARKADKQLGDDLEKEIAALMKRRTFGLVFEQHQPEAVELPGRAVRRGDKVRVLPPRGEVKQGDQRLWRVDRIERVDGNRVAHLLELDAEESERQAVITEDLVVVAEFNDRIYPGLVETGRVERGGSKPFHTVINAENFHALEMMTFTHRGTVDAIYIDPPYNTGAKDWKYNNNYVEADDDYRHSKWLAFMERRLKVARELLNPDDSVLIVTIDEKEVLRLGLLLEQTFPQARIQMISSLINPASMPRQSMFGRSDEYIFFVFFGSAAPVRMPLDSEWVSAKGRTFTGEIRWDLVMQSGPSSRRADSPNGFYPVFIDPEGPKVASVGDALPLSESPSESEDDSLIALWPIRRNGSEGRWRLGADTLRERLRRGEVRVGGNPKRGYTLYYLPPAELKKIESGVYEIEGRRPDGSPITSKALRGPESVPTTQWRIGSHDATQYGSRLLAQIMPDRKFPFPKSLYAVEDTLRFVVKNKPNAVILDFFSGSGTTAHAVMRLNKQDGGQRQCISITNNEVSADEQRSLRKKGFRPGDDYWDGQGICDYITKPRITAVITGRSPDSKPIKGDYRFMDEFPMAEGFEENAAFFTLTYEAPLSVRHNRAFERIAPMLWMRAGSRGRIITDLGVDGWDVAETYGVLEDLDRAGDFIARVNGVESVRMAFIVTDDDSAFQMVCRDLPSRVLPVRLYESYLQNFELRGGR